MEFYGDFSLSEKGATFILLYCIPSSSIIGGQNAEEWLDFHPLPVQKDESKIKPKTINFRPVLTNAPITLIYFDSFGL